MRRQWAIGAEEADERYREPGGFAVDRGLKARELRRGERHGWVLADPHGLLGGPQRGAEPRPIAKGAFEPPERDVVVELVRVPLELREEIQSVDRRPIRRGH